MHDRSDDKPGTGRETGEGARAGGRSRARSGSGSSAGADEALDTSVDVPVYDIDGFDHSADTVADLHDDGRKVICCLSTGAWEDWRPDAETFPDSVIGKGNGREGERRLDIRETDVLEPLMAARIDMCAEKGFDAVEPDNMDGYRNKSGFPSRPPTSSATTASSPASPTNGASRSA